MLERTPPKILSGRVGCTRGRVARGQRRGDIPSVRSGKSRAPGGRGDILRACRGVGRCRCAARPYHRVEAARRLQLREKQGNRGHIRGFSLGAREFAGASMRLGLVAGESTMARLCASAVIVAIECSNCIRTPLSGYRSSGTAAANGRWRRIGIGHFLPSIGRL